MNFGFVGDMSKELRKCIFEGRTKRFPTIVCDYYVCIPRMEGVIVIDYVLFTHILGEFIPCFMLDVCVYRAFCEDVYRVVFFVTSSA